MSKPLSDEDLQALFARQRGADHEQAPAFSALCTRTQAIEPAVPASRPFVWRWALPGAAALALGLAAVFSLSHSTKPPVVANPTLAHELEDIDAALQKSLSAQNSVTSWQSPTDFLLNPTHYETP